LTTKNRNDEFTRHSDRQIDEEGPLDTLQRLLLVLSLAIQ